MNRYKEAKMMILNRPFVETTTEGEIRTRNGESTKSRLGWNHLEIMNTCLETFVRKEEEVLDAKMICGMLFQAGT